MTRDDIEIEPFKPEGKLVKRSNGGFRGERFLDTNGQVFMRKRFRPLLSLSRENVEMKYATDPGAGNHCYFSIRMAVTANINQTKNYFDEAVSAGSTEKALILAEELRRKGVGMPGNEAITSICRKNGYETNIPNLTYGSLDKLENDIVKALSSGGGFDGMSEQHSVLIRAKIREQKRVVEAEDRDRFLADMVNGNVPEMEALEAEHQNGLISDKQYVWKSNTVKAWLKEQKKERLYGESQAEKARQKAVKEAKAELLLRIGMADFTGTSQENGALVKGFWDEAVKKFEKDFVTLNEINNSLKSASKEGNVFSTPEGKLCREVLSKAYKDGQLVYKPWGLFNNEEGAEFQAARYLELYDWMKEELKKKTPVDEIIKGCNDRVAELNAGKVKSFLSANMGTGRAPKTGNEKDRISRRKVNGRIAIFGSDKKFIRWEDGE